MRPRLDVHAEPVARLEQTNRLREQINVLRLLEEITAAQIDPGEPRELFF